MSMSQNQIQRIIQAYLNAAAVSYTDPCTGAIVNPITVTGPDTNTTYDLINNSDGTITLAGSDASTDIIDICGIIASSCNASMVLNPNGSVTFTDNAGTPTTIPASPSSTFTSNTNGTATITAGNGSTLTVCEICPVTVNNGNGTYTITNSDGSTVTINSTDTWVNNNNGTWTVTDNSTGTSTTIGASSTITSNGDGTATHTAADGTTFILSETPSSLVDNSDGTGTFTNSDGTTIDVCLNCPTTVDNNDGSYTVTNADGTSITITTTVDTDTWTSFVSNGNGTATFTDPDGNTLTVCEVCPNTVDNADGTATITNADGTTVDVSTGNTVVTSDTDHITVTPGANNTYVLDSCLLDALCTLEIKNTRVYRFSGITTPTTVFTIPALGAGETLSEILEVSLNGVGQDGLDQTAWGYTVSGLTVTTEYVIGDTGEPDFGYILYEVSTNLGDLINCANC